MRASPTIQTRQKKGQKKAPGVGDAIRRELLALSKLVRVLNKPQGAETIRPIVEATVEADARGGPPPPWIPPAAAALYNTLHFTYAYRATPLASPPQAKWAGAALLQPLVSEPAAEAVPLLHAYIDSPVRDRVRHCPVCGRWFLDATRPKHARRCSRACTITWSNALRLHNGSRQLAPRRGASATAPVRRRA
jgi:hypothetical protein